jgi:hypothetical protein
MCHTGYLLDARARHIFSFTPMVRGDPGASHLKVFFFETQTAQSLRYALRKKGAKLQASFWYSALSCSWQSDEEDEGAECTAKKRQTHGQGTRMELINAYLCKFFYPLEHSLSRLFTIAYGTKALDHSILPLGCRRDLADHF